MDAQPRSALKADLETARPAVSEDRRVYIDAALAHVEADVPPPVTAKDPAALARRIDHTQPPPEPAEPDIERLCEEARRHVFAAVCVNPCYVPLAAEALADTPVHVCTVIGFPLGATLPGVKAFEARRALEAGADELDMVLPVGLLKSGRYADVEADIRSVVQAAGEASSGEASGGGALAKVILETALLTDVEKAVACIAARRAGADFVKTSTGFSKGGATVEDVALMRQMVGAALGVKASGGVRTAAAARRMLAAGATRLGVSGSVALVEGAAAPAGY